MPVENSPTIRVVEPSLIKSYESDGSGSAGDAVKYDGSNDQVTPTSASGESVWGVLVNDSPDAGDEVSVARMGLLRANIADSVSAGDTLDTSSTAGQLTTDSGGSSADGYVAENHEGEMVVYLS